MKKDRRGKFNDDEEVKSAISAYFEGHQGPNVLFVLLDPTKQGFLV